MPHGLRTSLAVFALGAVLATPAAAQEGSSVDGTWQLVEAAGSGLMEPIAEDLGASLIIADGAVQGFSGCNDFTATYSPSGMPRFGAIATTTENVCEEAAAALESSLFTDLSVSIEERFEDGSLVFIGLSGSPVLRFTAAEDGVAAGVTPGSGLEGIEWTLVSRTVDGQSQAVDPGTAAVVRLADGSITGFDDCGAWIGGYALDAAAIAFDEPDSGFFDCDSPETAQLAALAEVRAWSLGDGRLTLLDADGASVLEFEPATTD